MHSEGQRGVGLHCLNHMNKALLFKWLWRFVTESDSLWRQVVSVKYGTMNWWDAINPRVPHGCSLQKGIIQLLPLFKEGLGYEVGNGRRTKFWEDAWCRESSLKQEFRDLFDMAVDSLSSVVTKFLVNVGQVVWTQVLRSALFDWEIPRLLQLLVRLADKHIDQDLEDRRIWKGDPRDDFSVRSCYGYIANPRMILRP